MSANPTRQPTPGSHLGCNRDALGPAWLRFTLGPNDNTMKGQDVIRFALLALRLTAFPFPITVGALLIVSHFSFGGFEADPYSDSGIEIGQMILAFFIAMIQLVWGAPSVLVLEKRRIGIGGYTVVGILSAVTLSLLVALVSYSPKLGETFHVSFGWTLLIFGVPLTYSYMLAFWVCRWCDKRWPTNRLQARPGSRLG